MVNTVKFSEFTDADLANTSNELVGVSSPSGGTNIKSKWPLRWDITTRPVAPLVGTLGYNTSLGQYEYWNGVSWTQLASGGSGSVNVGAQNDIAFYANNGTALSPISTQNNAGLFTNGLGEPSMVPATGTGAPVRQDNATLNGPILTNPQADGIEFTTTKGIVGTTTNDNADVGSVGEFIFSRIPFGSALLLTSNVILNLTSILLHEGDWDVWGNITFTASTGMTSYSCWSNIVSATLSDASLFFKEQVTSGSFLVGSGNVPVQRFSLAAPTTIYLSGVALFSVGTVNMCGGIYARVRR